MILYMVLAIYSLETGACEYFRKPVSDGLECYLAQKETEQALSVHDLEGFTLDFDCQYLEDSMDAEAYLWAMGLICLVGELWNWLLALPAKRHQEKRRQAFYKGQY